MNQRFLMIYSGVLTLVFAVTVLCGAASWSRHLQVDQLDVRRINLREPDGTLRMVISDKAEFPGAIVRGKEYRHPRADAGMLFYNDEGTENGGLIFSGHKAKNGKVIDSGGSLTFDQYEQDQIVQLVGTHDSDGHLAGMIVTDRPEHRPITEELAEMAQIRKLPDAQRTLLMQQRIKSGYYGSTRIRVVRGNDGDAEVALCDGLGHPRLVMAVAKDGAASLRFLDENGKVLNQLTPASKL